VNDDVVATGGGGGAGGRARSGGDEPRLVVDARGRRCPVPVIELARALPGVPVGGVLAVLADDEAAAVDVPAWCRMRGQEYVGEDVGTGGAPRYVVRRVG
jgi:cysteine desulfurase